VTAATDDAGAAGHVQIVKLALSTDGSATPIGADAQGLDVDVTRVQGTVTVAGVAADGAAVSGNPVLMAGTDGTNAQTIATTAAGAVQVHDGGNSLTVDSIVSSTATGSSVADSATSVTLLAANAARLGVSIANDSSARLYIKCGATASLTSYTASIGQHGYWECPFAYTGIIDGIWATDPGDGAARVAEFTA
jgi:hypothetical protein